MNIFIPFGCRSAVEWNHQFLKTENNLIEGIIIRMRVVIAFANGKFPEKQNTLNRKDGKYQTGQVIPIAREQVNSWKFLNHPYHVFFPWLTPVNPQVCASTCNDLQMANQLGRFSRSDIFYFNNVLPSWSLRNIFLSIAGCPQKTSRPLLSRFQESRRGIQLSIWTASGFSQAIVGKTPGRSKVLVRFGEGIADPLGVVTVRRRWRRKRRLTVTHSVGIQLILFT